MVLAIEDGNAHYNVNDVHDRAVNEDIIAMDMLMHDGYRYIPLHDLHDGCRLKWPVPGHVSLSPHDRSSEIIVGGGGCKSVWHVDRQFGGYRSVMATHGLSSGSAFFEVLLERPNVRLGIAQLWAHLGGPVGMDRYGFGVTDSGHVVHDAMKRQLLDYALPPNTIVGLLVHIPTNGSLDLYTEQVVFEHQSLPFLQCKIAKFKSNAPSIPGSNVKLYINGQDKGVIFTDLPQSGAYFPMFSVFRDGKATVNFGPRFVFPPMETCMPWSDLYHE